MALQYVGGTSGAGTGASYTVSLSGTLTGGIASSPAAGDIVVVATGFGATASSAPTVSGNTFGAYTGLGAASYANDTWDTNFRMFYAVMGSTPDTTLTIGRVSNAAYGGAAVVHVWRGVDTASPINQTGTPATTTNGSRGNPPAVTPSVGGAIVIAGGAGTQGTAGSAFTVPSGMTNAVSVFSDGTTSDIGVWIASGTGTNGAAYDPDAWTGGATSNSSSAAAQTIALRPALDPRTGDLDATETGSDTASMAGGVAATGSLTASEAGADAFSASGSVSDAAVTGLLAASESGSDIFAAAGDVFVKGGLAATEAGKDGFAGTGDVFIKGPLAATESGGDTFAATGTLSPGGITGSLSASESGNDALAATGKVVVKGSAAATEAGTDAMAAIGDVFVRGYLAVSEAGKDTLTAAGDVFVMGSLSRSESGADAAAIQGKVLVLGALSVAESGSDTFLASSAGLAQGSMSATEGGSDTMLALGAVEVELGLPARVNGSGGRRGRKVDDAEIRHVHEAWDAVEETRRLQALRRAPPPAAQSPAVDPEPSASPRRAFDEIAPPVLIPLQPVKLPPIKSAPHPMQAPEPAVDLAALREADDEEALLLMLAELA